MLELKGFLFVLVTLPLSASDSASAQNTDHLFHVKSNTIACGSADAITNIAGLDTPRITDPRIFDQVFRTGKCFTITPRSLWKQVEDRGSLVLMSYVGTTGAPGSYFFQRSVLFDDNDNNPPVLDRAAAPALKQTAPTPPPLPPVPGPNLQTPSPLSVNRSSEVALAPPTQTATPAKSANSADNDSSAGTWLFWITLILASIIALMLYNARKKREAARARLQMAMSIALAEVGKQSARLRVKMLQLTIPDFYGTVDYGPWWKEKERFYASRIIPLLDDRGVGDLIEAIKPTIMSAIDEKASDEIQPTGAYEPLSTPEVFHPNMNPIDYELHCAMLLAKAGWTTRATPITGDQGADILAERSGRSLVVQCKLYSSPVGNGAVQEAYSARTFQGADIAAVVSNAPFTKSARQLAATNGVHLLHHEQLVAFVG